MSDYLHIGARLLIGAGYDVRFEEELATVVAISPATEQRIARVTVRTDAGDEMNLGEGYARSYIERFQKAGPS